LDLSTGDGEVKFTLTLDLHGVWNPEYVFSLLPVGLEKVDVLEAQMRDMQEECTQLREQVAELLELPRNIAFLSVSSVTACPQGQVVTWDAPAPREMTTSHFDLSADYNLVTIRVAGVYQVQVRLAVTSSANSQQSITIILNSVNVAACTQSDASSHQNTPQLFEMMRLQVEDKLQIRCDASQGSLNVALANRLTIVCLGN
jgi:hypothetical protein